MSQEVKRYIRTCDVCQRVKYSRTSRAPLQPIRPTQPLELLTTDIAGPLPPSVSGNVYILVVCDHMTKFVQIYAMKDMQATTVAKHLVNFMMKFGICDSILSDQGKNYQSLLLEAVYELLDVKQLRTTPYHPECDGISERFIQTLKQMVTCFVNESQDDWDMHLEELAFAYNTATQSSTKFTPFELMFGRQAKIPLDLTLKAEMGVAEVAVSGPTTNHKLAKQYVEEMGAHMNKVYELVSRNRDSNLDKAKWRHDRKIKPNKYVVGDLCLKVSRTARVGLARKTSGPFRVMEVVSDQNYLIKRVDQHLKVVQSSRTERVHHNNVKKYYVRADRNTVEEENELPSTPVRRAYRKNPDVARWAQTNAEERSRHAERAEQTDNSDVGEESEDEDEVEVEEEELLGPLAGNEELEYSEDLQGVDQPHNFELDPITEEENDEPSTPEGRKESREERYNRINNKRHQNCERVKRVYAKRAECPRWKASEQVESTEREEETRQAVEKETERSEPTRARRERRPPDRYVA